MNHAFLDVYAGLNSPIHRLDARLKIIVAFGFVALAVSTPPSAGSAFAGYAVFLAGIWLLSRVPAGYVLKRLAVLLPCVGLVALFIPFLPAETAGCGYHLGWAGLTISRTGLLVFWNVLAKALLGALAVILLTSTTPFPKLLTALAQLRLPRLLIMILSFAYRYIFVLVDETQRMLRARDSRCYTGRWLWQAAVIGRMIGVLFLRSYERGERVYLAMLARGFDGTFPRKEAAPLKPRDYLCACGASGILLALRLCSL